MPGLHIPGIPTRPNDKAARKRNGPAFTTFPHRVAYKDVSISHSFSDSVGSSIRSSAVASSSSSCSYSSCSSASSSVELVPRPVVAVPRSSASTSTRYAPLVVSRSRPQAGEVARPCTPIPSPRFSTRSKLQPLCSSCSSPSISTTSSQPCPFVIPRTRPRAGDAPIPCSRYSARFPSPTRPSGPTPWSRDSTLSRPQSLYNSTRSPPPARPSGPIPWSRDSTLSRTHSLRNSTRSPPPARPIPPSAYSTLSKLQHLQIRPRYSRPTSATSTRSSPAPPTRSVPPFSAGSSSSTSIRSDSFPSTRCFIAAALKAVTIRSSPATTASHVSTSTSARSSSTTSTRSASLISSPPPPPPPPPVRFNCAGDRLEAVREVISRHRREHAQLCADSSSASKAVSSSHGSDNGSARARTSCRRNVKPAKSVQFGGVTVHEVNTWIKPGVHTQRDPTTIVGKLVGWSVTPLEEPEDDEDCKYTTYWGGQVSQLTHAHLPGKPCGRSFCSWNDLANVRRDLCRVARLEPDNPYTSIRTRLVFEEFNRRRENMRGHGHFLL